MSWQLSLFNFGARLLVKPVLRRQTDVPRARRSFEFSTRLLTRMPPGVLRFWDRAGLWLSAKLRPERDHQVLLWLHGGGYIVGSPDTHRAMVARLARRLGMRALLPDYRLAPEHPFPAAYQDTLAAWDALIARGYAPGDIVVGGDSAGGGLALALTAHLCTQGTPPAAVVGFSPWTDLTLSGGSMADNADTDVFFPPERSEFLRDLSAGSADLTDPRLSPLFAEFPGCPPVLLQCSESEILRDDTARMADRLRDQGAEVTVQELADAPHVWQLFCPLLPEANRSLAEAAEFLQSHVPPRPQDAG